jgi:hypothetical protein
MKIATATLAILFLALSLPAAGEGHAVQDASEVNTVELRLLLNSFGALGEGQIENVLERLRIIAATQEAQSGEWEKMRSLLQELETSGIPAAAIWFVRPDGSYYSLKQGLNEQNLKDRDYFPKLMAGADITGDLVISKSTGKRTAIVAVPLRKGDEIIGALGTSLAVEAMSRSLNEQMGLPENILFYALDPKGRTSLHRISALLFAYPSDMGSKSLVESVDQMLAEPEGEVTYDFYGGRKVVFKKYPLTGWTYAIGMVTGRPGQPAAVLPPVLSELDREITAELTRMDQNLAEVARRFSEKGLPMAEKRKVLSDLCRSSTYAVDCSFVDRSGRMVLVEPGEYAKFEGSDISAQEQVVRLHKTHKPVMSNAFRAVEGFEAVDLEYPVLAHDGKLQGSVSMLIRHDLLLSSILDPVLRPIPLEAFMMQPDGRILYDEDEEEVGRMLFSDPLYQPHPQLLALGFLISREKTGAGSYDFRQKGSKKVVNKDAHWTTVGLHGTEWRLVLMHVRADDAPSPTGTAE